MALLYHKNDSRMNHVKLVLIVFYQHILIEMMIKLFVRNSYFCFPLQLQKKQGLSPNPPVDGRLMNTGYPIYSYSLNSNSYCFNFYI